MTNREQIGRLLTTVLVFLRDHDEPATEDLRDFATEVNAILRDVCGNSYPALPLTGPAIFYQGEQR